MSTNLSDKAMLVSVIISQWAGRKLDRRATETVAQSHKTTDRAGNFTKKLLPGASELARISQLASQIRQYVYTQTLPWHTDGSRILANQNYFPFSKRMQEYREEYSRAVDDFISVYPELVERAKAELGDLFSETEYPTAQGLRHRFSCEVDVMPIPTFGDFRVSLLDSDREMFASKMKQVEAQALQECWNRLYDVVSKASRVLTQPDAKFRDTLITSILGICSQLPQLNPMHDPKLESMRQEIEGLVAGFQPDNLRESPQDRINAAIALSDAEAKMRAYMGG